MWNQVEWPSCLESQGLCSLTPSAECSWLRYGASYPAACRGTVPVLTPGAGEGLDPCPGFRCTFDVGGGVQCGAQPEPTRTQPTHIRSERPGLPRRKADECVGHVHGSKDRSMSIVAFLRRKESKHVNPFYFALFLRIRKVVCWSRPELPPDPLDSNIKIQKRATI